MEMRRFEGFWSVVFCIHAHLIDFFLTQIDADFHRLKEKNLGTAGSWLGNCRKLGVAKPTPTSFLEAHSRRNCCSVNLCESLC